jgi:hypothetical protein
MEATTIDNQKTKDLGDALMQEGCVHKQEFLPRDIIIGAALYAEKAAERGELIPNDKVYGILAKELGWK